MRSGELSDGKNISCEKAFEEREISMVKRKVVG